jgi:hypothetical protein
VGTILLHCRFTLFSNKQFNPNPIPMLFEFIKNHPSALLSVALTALVVIVRLIFLLKEMNDLQIPAANTQQYQPIKKNTTYKRTFSDAA